MKYVEAELKKGSEKDIVLLIMSFVVAIIGFSFMYETDFWAKNEYSWKPLSFLGLFVFVLYSYRRVFGGKFKVTLLEQAGDNILFQSVKYINLSGWVKENIISAKKTEIESIKIINFYNVPTHTGMYWVCFTLSNNNVIEYRLNDYKIIKDIKSFIGNCLPDVKVITDGNT